LNKNLELSRENRNSSIESEFESKKSIKKNYSSGNLNLDQKKLIFIISDEWGQNVTAQLSTCRKIHETGRTQYKVSKWTQFRVILKKSSTCILRDQVNYTIFYFKLNSMWFILNFIISY